MEREEKALKQSPAPYQKMLGTYPNLQQVANALKNMKFGSNNGYDTVLFLLGGSYSPNQDWRKLQALFDEQLPTTIFGQKIFLARTIHILWMEKHFQDQLPLPFQKLWPWSIKNYPKDKINDLFYEEWVNNYGGEPELKPKISIPVTAINFEEYADPQLELEASYQQHELALKLRDNTQESTVANAVRWIKTEFFHAYNSWGFDRYTGKPNPYVVAPGEFLPANLDSLFCERIIGCHEPVMLLSEILRSLNIPALNLNVYGHGVTYISSLDRYVHGDHLAKRPLVPVSLMLLTKDEIMQYSDMDPMLYDLIDNKVKAFFGPDLAWLFTCGIARTGTTLTLPIEYTWKIPVPANIVTAFQSEAPQYHIQYDQASMQFTSQPVPIRSLLELSKTGVNIWG